MPEETNDEKIKRLEIELKELIAQKRKNGGLTLDTIPKRTAASEAHTHILAGRNIGVVGIGSVVLTVMVALINSVASSITALACIGVLGYMTFMRVRHATYLEKKYALDPKPIFNKPITPGGFQV